MMGQSKGDAMDAREVLRRLTEESPVWSQNKVAAQLGISPQNMSNKMRCPATLKVDLVADYLSVLGYDLVAVPKQSRLPNGSVPITGGRG